MASTPPLVYGILGEGGKSLKSHGATESVAKSHWGEGELERISRLWLPKGHLLPGRTQAFEFTTLHGMPKREFIRWLGDSLAYVTPMKRVDPLLWNGGNGTLATCPDVLEATGGLRLDLARIYKALSNAFRGVFNTRGTTLEATTYQTEEGGMTTYMTKRWTTSGMELLGKSTTLVSIGDIDYDGFLSCPLQLSTWKTYEWMHAPSCLECTISCLMHHQRSDPRFLIDHIRSHARIFKWIYSGISICHPNPDATKLAQGDVVGDRAKSGVPCACHFFTIMVEFPEASAPLIGMLHSPVLRKSLFQNGSRGKTPEKRPQIADSANPKRRNRNQELMKYDIDAACLVENQELVMAC
ncbi:hypothetical protein VNO77_19450 [Canavalia gladiata]|uniref:Uncharacterized protein n=1 Tax=Canavalia gladiata TaxID=3824 RepID=A0AAN9LRC4_CANGL